MPCNMRWAASRRVRRSATFSPCHRGASEARANARPAGFLSHPSFASRLQGCICLVSPAPALCVILYTIRRSPLVRATCTRQTADRTRLPASGSQVGQRAAGLAVRRDRAVQQGAHWRTRPGGLRQRGGERYSARDGGVAGGEQPCTVSGTCHKTPCTAHGCCCMAVRRCMLNPMLYPVTVQLMRST